MADLVYPDESYELVGAAMATFNQLGFGYQEKYYYRGYKKSLEDLGYKVTEQVWTPIIISGKKIGGYYLYFLAEKGETKIVLELKVANAVYPQHIRQVYGYLKSNNVKLGIIIVFSKNGVITKRIVN